MHKFWNIKILYGNFTGITAENKCLVKDSVQTMLQLRILTISLSAHFRSFIKKDDRGSRICQERSKNKSWGCTVRESFFPYILLNVQRRLMKVFNAGNYWEVISESSVPSSTRKIARIKTAIILHIVSMFNMWNWKRSSGTGKGRVDLCKLV